MTYIHDPEQCGCEGHHDFCPYNPNAENYDPELTKKILESKPEQQEVHTEKPDFEAMAKEIYPHGVIHEALSIPEDSWKPFIAGCELIWKDHVEHYLHCLSVDQEVMIKQAEQMTSLQSELKQAKEENAMLKEQIGEIDMAMLLKSDVYQQALKEYKEKKHFKLNKEQ